MDERYPLLRAFLDGRLPEVLVKETAAQRERPLVELPEQAIQALAAAIVRVRIEDEWFELQKILGANGRKADLPLECRLYDDIRDRVADGEQNWNQVLEDCGRTRSLLADAEAIRLGRPEIGWFYWY